MIFDKDLTLTEISLALAGIQTQLNKLIDIVNAATETEDLTERKKKAEETIRAINIAEMKSHGTTPEEIVEWYWNNYHHTAILATTPNGDHPLCFEEWVQGRMKYNKETDAIYYKDYLCRVITKGGYIEVLPF